MKRAANFGIWMCWLFARLPHVAGVLLAVAIVAALAGGTA